MKFLKNWAKAFAVILAIVVGLLTLLYVGGLAFEVVTIHFGGKGAAVLATTLVIAFISGMLALDMTVGPYGR